MLLKDNNDGVYLPYSHLGRISYKAYSLLSNHNLPILKEKNICYDSEIIKLYTQLPKKYDKVRKLTLSITEPADNIYDKVKLVEKYLKKNYRYSWTLPRVDKQQVIEDFLFLEMKWYKYVINYDMLTQLKLIHTIRNKLINLYLNIDILQILNILLLFIIITAAILLFRNVYKKKRMIIKRNYSKITDLYLMLFKVLVRNGIKKDKSLTLKEFTEWLYSKNELIAHQLSAFIDIYYPIRFGNKKFTCADEAKLIKIIKNLKV